jgi:hypothetical protein
VEQAIQIASTHKLTAAVVHRLSGLDEHETVRTVRAVDARVPVVMISGVDQQATAADSGATRFHHFQNWRELGSAVADLIARQSDGSSDEPKANGNQGSPP